MTELSSRKEQTAV